VVIIISYFYEYASKTASIKRTGKAVTLAILCLTLCGFAGLRTSYNDTETYINGFLNSQNQFAELFNLKFSISNVYLFKIWNYLIFTYISSNVNVYLFLCSVVFVAPYVYLIAKNSKNFTISVFLFMFLGGYLFSLAGIKQAMATGIIMMGIPSLINKKYLKFYLCCIVAVGFHTYSFIFMILPLLGKEVFNKRTGLFIAIVLTVGVGMSYFSEVISAIIKLLEHNVEDEIVFTGSVNVLRAVVFTIPFILALFAKDTICETCSDGEKWFLKISILSSVFMILALFGNPILFGRIPQYFLIGIK
jgi:hypothetical protein